MTPDQVRAVIVLLDHSAHQVEQRLALCVRLEHTTIKQVPIVQAHVRIVQRELTAQ